MQKRVESSDVDGTDAENNEASSRQDKRRNAPKFRKKFKGDKTRAKMKIKRENWDRLKVHAYRNQNVQSLLAMQIHNAPTLIALENAYFVTNTGEPLK